MFCVSVFVWVLILTVCVYGMYVLFLFFCIVWGLLAIVKFVVWFLCILVYMYTFIVV